MALNRRPEFRRSTFYKFLIVVALVSVLLGYAAVSYKSKHLPHIIINLSNVHQNIKFTSKTVYFQDGVAYDFYSIDELTGRSRPGPQWKTFPLPNEQISANMTPWTLLNQQQNQTSFVNISVSPKTVTDLAFVDHIYITSTPNRTDRQANFKKMFARYRITKYEWRLKWTRDICNTPKSKNKLHRKPNLRVEKPLSKQKEQEICSLTMKHIDIWHDIVARNSSSSLILEDDAVFVSNFREKFDRTIYTAIRTGALKIGGLSHCVSGKSRLSANSNEWFEQDPVIVIGSCSQAHDNAFAKNRRDAPPILSTQKQRASRCTHAYLLTACSARALLRQTDSQTNTVVDTDIFLDRQVVLSPTLQSFWLDPPIVY